MSLVRTKRLVALCATLSFCGCTLGPDFGRAVVREVVLDRLEMPVGLVVVRGDELALMPDAGCMRFTDVLADGGAKAQAEASRTTARPGDTPVYGETWYAVILWNEPLGPVAESSWYPISELPAVLASGEIEPQLIVVASTEPVPPERFQDLKDVLWKHGLPVMQSSPPGYATESPD